MFLSITKKSLFLFGFLQNIGKMSGNDTDSELIDTLKQLQREVKKLERSEASFGQSSDTITFRRRIEKELSEAEETYKKLEKMLVFRRQSSLGISNNSNQFEKIIKQYDAEKKRYEEVTSSVRTKMKQFTPIDDGSNGKDENYGRDSTKKVINFNMEPQQQVQQANSFVAIVDHLAEQEQRTQKMEEMVQGLSYIPCIYKI
ncbi:hypothetical protein RFI_25374 [Reticulomyxa filosa]|uniref:Syntaxin N-terminal domain-containing protein n=1 Tax=Reticulomyxa filosa TaxID=46433 RepID=X6MF17_RETFI|nr:hypothetical protein RFI_25374 [Reticulomyxa filosa]|eukprot:ETO12002.1 hypothetical protein RFI_25374 [Reticulomyxa filosa]